MSVHRQNFKALLVILAAVIVGGIVALCGKQDISGRYRGKANFEWLVIKGEKKPAADILEKAEIKDIDIELILNQSQKNVSGKITLSKKGDEMTVSIESGVIEGDRISFITRLPIPYSGRFKFAGRISGRSLQGNLLMTAPGQYRESGFLEGTLTATKQ